MDRDMIRRASDFSLIDFTDLTPLNQEEIDLFWPFEGSELERKIALRLATRTAEEALAAITAKWSGTHAPCHKCGKKKALCRCLVTCPTCWVRHYKDTAHECDPDKIAEIASDPFGSLFASIRQV